MTGGIAHVVQLARIHSKIDLLKSCDLLHRHILKYCTKVFIPQDDPYPFCNIQ